MWHDLLRKRDEHTELALKHFSLKREDVERVVTGRLEAS